MNAQLDLFRDSRSVVLANEAIVALSARDAARAAASLAKLRCEAPDYPSLPGLDTLTRALAGWRKPPGDAVAILCAVTWLDHDVASIAQAGLGQAAEAFLGTFFRDLADAARGLAYEPTRPTAYRAWLCLRGGEWGSR